MNKSLFELICGSDGSANSLEQFRNWCYYMLGLSQSEVDKTLFAKGDSAELAFQRFGDWRAWQEDFSQEHNS